MSFKTIEEYEREMHLLKGEKSTLEKEISWLVGDKINRLAVVEGEIERRLLYIRKIAEGETQ